MKEIIWLTNYNKKLLTDNFLHLDLAPKNGIPESKFPQAVRIITNDNSVVPKECFLLYITRFKMRNVGDTITLLSHGIIAKKFTDEKMKDKRINWETEMAAYVYSTDENNIDYFMPLLNYLNN